MPMITYNQRQASENLVDVLLSFMPDSTGKILDVACGTGASTQRLLRHYKASDVHLCPVSKVAEAAMIVAFIS
jgi:16S rRNA G1207 methylase RsmC